MKNINNKDINYFLNMKYEELREYLLDASADELKEILSNPEIKKKLICPENRHEFSWLVQENSKDIIPYLLDGEGMEILKKSEFFTDKMNAILTSNTSYVDTLLSIEKFQNLIFDNFDELGYYLYAVSPIGGQYLIRKAQKEGFDLVKLISKFQELAQIEAIKTCEFTNDNYWRMISSLSKEASSMLLKEKSVGKSLVDINLPIIESIAKKNITLPHQIIEDIEFTKRISSIPDIKTYRFLINDLEKSNDIEKIEKARQKYYDNQINSYNKETGMLKIYEDFYKEISSMNEINPFLSIEKTKEIFKDQSDNEIFDFLNNVSKINKKSGLDGIKKFLQEQSNIMLSNIIIDYNFKEYYLNVLKDVKQLCNFNRLGGDSLTSEKIEIYKKILNIDTLTYEEKIELNEELKKKNYVEEFYDDVRNSRNKMYSLIQEKILNENKINKYLDKEASTKSGVNIYRLEGDTFFAFVKSLMVDKQDKLSLRDIHSYKDAGSFSIDASNKLNTFKDPRSNYNLIFNGFNVDQVVHMFPVDSFSGYERGEKATDRIIELLTPEEFTGRSRNYNEVIISQKNERKPSDMDDRLPLPKPFAIYCYDEIGPNDIESAKKLGIGILVVNTKKYNVEKKDSQISMFETMHFENNGEKFKYVDDKSHAIMEESHINKR